MKNKYLFILLVIGSISLQKVNAQMTITNGTVTIASGTTVTFQQYLNNQAAGVLNHSGTINIAGNLTNDGTITANSNSIVNFNGATAQIVNGAVPFALYDAQVNQYVTLNNSITMNNVLTLNQILNADAGYPVFFATTATNPAEATGKYILGTARMNTRAIGTAALDFLGVDFSMGGDLGNVDIERISGPNGRVTVGANTGIDMRWKLTASNTNVTKTSFKLKFLPVFDNGKNLTAIHMYRGTAAYDKWFQVSTVTQDISASNPRVYTYTNYLYQNIKPGLTLSDVANILPVNFTTFRAVPKGGNVLVEWGIENSKKGTYVVERSEDGINFQSIGQLPATGDLSYNYVDLSVSTSLASTLYYRVEFVEEGGSNFTAIASVYLDGGDLLVGVYPVPFGAEGINVIFANPSRELVSVRLLNQLGLEITSYKDDSSVINPVFLGKGLATGLYFIEINSSFLNKIVKVTKE